jgi:hypothetical protein
MAVNPLPPQAFTKETLQKAYAWLLTQNSSIKEMANTQDMLISLYLKAQRGGEAALETPSIQNFKQELKSLANLMGDLQTTQPPAPQVSSHVSVSPQTAPIANSIPAAPATSYAPMQNSALLSQLDGASLNALAEVKITLNLSSEIEALRALIALGYKQFKKI